MTKHRYIQPKIVIIEFDSDVVFLAGSGHSGNISSGASDDPDQNNPPNIDNGGNGDDVPVNSKSWADDDWYSWE